MANSEHLAKLKESVEAWNIWRAVYPDIHPNLKGADFSGADLGLANLRETCLEKAKMHGANLIAASLAGAFLDGANLSEADLSHADLRNADLVGANLSGADLLGTDFTGADLDEVEVSGAKLHLAHFGDNDLSNVRGLESARYYGPSRIGIDTIYRSNGKIPEAFLRGCGVSDTFITFAKSLVGSPVEFYSCFISYSTRNQDFADRLYADLQNKGVRCWFAPHDIQSGKKIHEQIDEAIRLHDKLLLILSPHSMESEWVKTEIAKARKREVRDKRRVLFPIRLAPFETLRDWECFDADTGKDSAREIREYFIPDFSNWKEHDSYQEAFQRLISDLKASDSRPKP